MDSSMNKDSNNLPQTIKDSAVQGAMLSRRSEKTSFAVAGMMCSDCIEEIERALRAVQGVNSVTVRIDDDQVEVDGLHEPQAIIDIFEQLGYVVGTL